MASRRFASLHQLILAGCLAQSITALAAPTSPVDASIEKSIALLTDGQPKAANGEINRALARVPSNANLHFLNGLAYQQLAEEVGQGFSPLAETGYRLAVEFDPGNWLAAWQLGLIQLEQGKYADARGALAKAARLRPRNADIQLALAGSAYLASDLPVALVAAESTLQQRADDPEALRIAALSSAMLGMDASAEDFAERLKQVRPADAETIRDRIDAIKAIGGQGGEKLAQADTSRLSDASLPTSSQLPAMPGGTASSNDPVQGWNDCVSPAATSPSISPNTWNPGNTGWGGGYGNNLWGSNNQPLDATERLSPLPFPCKGLPLPRMAVVDVTIIRTQEVTDITHGLNLLDGLKVILGGGWSTTNGSKTITRSLGLGSGVTYSLNIFNAADTMADVIARPSLLVLDRTPATFFSGYSVTVALPGQYGGSINDKNIGVSLSVTPTFINDDQILLAVKGARSFVEPSVDTQTLDQAMATSNNTVFTSVVMRFGETLILSGLREREQIRDKRGVPVLRDVPLLQYLFSTRWDYDYSHHVLIVLTPRKPSTLADTARAAAEHGQTEMDAVGRKATDIVRQRRSNLEAILARIQAGVYRDELLSGEVSSRRFARYPSLERILQDFRQLLYY